MASQANIFLHLFVILAFTTATTFSKLSPNFYDKVCPQALPTIKCAVDEAVNKERRMGASLLRLHFHDCFVQGCDASILLDSTSVIDSEKTAGPNNNSARGFEVIDQIKSKVDKICGGPVVSCADVLAVVARDSVVALGGPTWEVQLGRRDSTTASKALANSDIPSPLLNLTGLIQIFKNQGLDERDLVALSGGHTLGFAQCRTFRSRVYNDSNIDPSFASYLQNACPLTSSENGDSILTPLDSSSARFDGAYFSNLVKYKGVLHSDQALFNGGGDSTSTLVKSYSYNPEAFSVDFARSMVKMGNINPLVGDQGQVRHNCRALN
ncbi:hypothetical protein ACFE04_001026 [Oxalis oulophora]